MTSNQRRRAAVLLAAGGILAAVLPPVPALAAAPRTDYPCEKYLTQWAGKTVRSVWTFDIDKAGRPAQAKAVNLAKLEGREPKRTKCETMIGGWGGKGYDGGHLIAATLKGVSKRINLVPQRHSINIGIYKTFENAAKRCLALEDMKITNYTSQVHYPDAKTVVPSGFTVSMLPHKKGTRNTEIKLEIPNTDITPQKEGALKKKLNTGLEDNECPTVSGPSDDPDETG